MGLSFGTSSGFRSCCFRHFGGRPKQRIQPAGLATSLVFANFRTTNRLKLQIAYRTKFQPRTLVPFWGAWEYCIRGSHTPSVRLTQSVFLWDVLFVGISTQLASFVAQALPSSATLICREQDDGLYMALFSFGTSFEFRFLFSGKGGNNAFSRLVRPRALFSLLLEQQTSLKSE